MERCYEILNFPSNIGGEQIYTPSLNETFNTALGDYLLNEEVYNGDIMMNDWFPKINADVFISHSHRDCPGLERLAEQLEGKGVKCFIDSLVWGYADDLLLEIDADSEYYNKTGYFDYDRRNKTTAFVHILLNSALLQMIDKCSIVLFFDTDNSISKDDLFEGKTFSPWIYSEISMCNAILKDRELEQSRITNFSLEEQIIKSDVEFKAAMTPDLTRFTKRNYSLIHNWVESSESGVYAFKNTLSNNATKFQLLVEKKLKLNNSRIS